MLGTYDQALAFSQARPSGHVRWEDRPIDPASLTVRQREQLKRNLVWQEAVERLTEQSSDGKYTAAQLEHMAAKIERERQRPPRTQPNETAQRVHNAVFGS